MEGKEAAALAFERMKVMDYNCGGGKGIYITYSRQGTGNIVARLGLLGADRGREPLGPDNYCLDKGILTLYVHPEDRIA